MLLKGLYGVEYFSTNFLFFILGDLQEVDQFFLFFCVLCWQNVSTVQNNPKRMNSTDSPYSPLDSVKCVMGYTQRFTTIEHKGSTALCMGSKSLVSFVSFFSCAVFDMYTSL